MRQVDSVIFSSIDAVHDFIGPKAFKPVSSFNAAAFDSILLAVSRRLAKGPILDGAAFNTAYAALIDDANYKLWTSRSTADDEVVKKRIEAADHAFASVS